MVKVLENGFEYDGVEYSSLSAIARKITGTNWNGFKFFGL
jgi:putative bacteriophage related protein